MDELNPWLQNVVLPMIGTIIVGLLIALTWFVKRLFEKIDQVDQLPIISDAIKGITEQLRKLEENYKSVNEINTRVSILERLFDHYLSRRIGTRQINGSKPKNRE